MGTEILSLGKKRIKEVPTVKKMKQIISHVVNTRLGFILTLLVLYWLKTMWAYHVDFSLGLENPYQLLLSIINPIPLGLLLLRLSLYIKRTRVFISLVGLSTQY